ncbi:MAG TPA: hypothetical protein PKW66_11855 [Polyangiaceae bacterium]|nr:hypothetical protein [Polyangiaceae bacterium]
MQAAAQSNDDLLDDLPPLDGEEEGEEQDVGLQQEFLEENDTACGEEQDGFPDFSLPVGELIDTPWDIDRPSLEEGDELAGVDPVQDDIPPFDISHRREDDDDEGVTNDDIALGIDDLEAVERDDGAEGTSDSLDNEVNESAFPHLDTSDDGDDGDQVDVGLIDLPDEVALPAWAEARWHRTHTPLVAAPMSFVICTPRLVAAAGHGICFLDECEGTERCAVLPIPDSKHSEFVSMGFAPRDRVMLASRQRFFETTRSVQTCQWFESGLSKGDAIAHVVYGLCDRAFSYASTTQGELLVSADHGRTWKRVDGLGKVLGLTSDEKGNAHILTVSETSFFWLDADDEGRWESKLVKAVLSTHGVAALAASSDTWVAALEDGALLASPDRGETWFHTKIPVGIQSLAILPNEAKATIVGAIYLESHDRSVLFSWIPGQEPTLVADLSPDVAVVGADADPTEGLGRAHHLRWDPFRGCLWVAGAFGLIAWSPSLPT